jgi:hypothetical protein
VSCIAETEGQGDYENHKITCKKANPAANRRFFLADVKVLDRHEASIQFLQEDNVAIIPQRHKAEPKKRSLACMWLPYLKGTVSKGTAVCFAFQSKSTKVQILNGLTVSQSGPSDVVVSVDGKEHRVALKALYLMPPTTKIVRRTTSRPQVATFIFLLFTNQN